MKKIDTLVEDIYDLFTSNTEITINNNDLEELAESIKKSIVSALSRKQQDRKKTLRLSLIGHPDRKIWYDLKSGAEKEQLSGPTLIKFLYGDILEALLIFLCKQSGHTVEEEQKEVEVAGVLGHHDAIVDGVLVDFKSASPYGFKKFKEGTVVSDDPFGYIAQISAYSTANNTTEAGFIAIDKSGGEIAYCPIHSMDMINAENRINYIKAFLEHDTPPKKCYDPIPDGSSGNMRLAVGCSFCDYKYDCWKDANGGKGIRTFNYSNGPKHLVQVGKEPNVPEVT